MKRITTIRQSLWQEQLRRREKAKMPQQSRRRLLINAVRDAAIELATRARYATAPLDNNKPAPDEVCVVVAIESTARGPYLGPYLDIDRPTPDEIRAADAAMKSAKAMTGANFDITAEDQLWVAYAINTVTGARYPGLGHTPAQAKACAWIYSHWPGGTTSALVKVSTEVPDGWTFELYPPPKPKPQMLTISTLDILDLVRLTVPDVTADEVANIIMQSLPYMGGRRQ
jgi:hypothetical protein